MRKIIGVILITLGLLIIFWTISESYFIFKGLKEPPSLFILPKEKTKKQILKPKTIQEKIEAIQREVLKEEFAKRLPPDSLVKLLNLISWSIGAFIFFSGGGKISQIGISLLQRKKKRD